LTDFTPGFDFLVNAVHHFDFPVIAWTEIVVDRHGTVKDRVIEVNDDCMGYMIVNFSLSCLKLAAFPI
jgi:hypothetical protein